MRHSGVVIYLEIGSFADCFLGAWYADDNTRITCHNHWRTKVRAVLTDLSTVSGFNLAWFSSLSAEHAYVFMVLCI